VTRPPSLRWRLLLLVSIASLLILVLASSLAYERARHEVHELMDIQLSKTAQLVLAQALDADGRFAELSQWIAEIQRVNAGHDPLTLEFQIGMPDGTVLARSPHAPEAPLAGPLGYATFLHDDGDWRTLTLESGAPPLRAQVAESIPKRNKDALEIAHKTVQPLLLILPILLFAIYFSVRRGLKPLDDLASEVATRSSDNLSPLAARKVPREAQPLVTAINRVFHRLAESIESERRFTADAAHELRTPLAAAKIQAQVAQMSPNPASREHALANMIAGLDRATRLVEQMLRLARLDPLSQLPHPQEVDLAELTERVAAGIQDAMPSARIRLDLGQDLSPVQGDPDLLEVALRNLIDNAVRYSPEGAEVAVIVRKGPSGMALSIQDEGPGVAEEELPRLIERFYRSASATAEGSGLGLTIVGRIAELHCARLEFANRAGGGFEARLAW
jgi:two-component system sensor histidine kinase QseC